MKKILGIISFSLLTGSGFAQSDACVDAVSITPTFTQCSYQAGSSGNATQSYPTCSGGGIADDDVWYSFIANSADMEIKVSPTVGYPVVLRNMWIFDQYPLSGCEWIEWIRGTSSNWINPGKHILF